MSWGPVANLRHDFDIFYTILKYIFIFKEEFYHETRCIHIQRDESGGSVRCWLSGHPLEFPISCTEAQSWKTEMQEKCPALPWPCHVGERKLNAKFSCMCQVLSSATAGGRLMTESSGACCHHKLKTNPISMNSLSQKNLGYYYLFSVIGW